MIKAGALYFAIVIAFFIAIISASLIMLTSHYQNTYLKEIRFARLLNNLKSGIAYVLAENDVEMAKKTIDLYGDQTDSIEITRSQWGIFDLALLKTVIQQDTLSKILLIGKETDLTVLFLCDEDRPLSVSGDTKVTGKAELPKSGVRKSYAEGKPYTNNQTIFGSSTHSSRTLKPLDIEILRKIRDEFEVGLDALPLFPDASLKRTHLTATAKFKLPKVASLGNVNLDGNIILYSDSIVTIASSAKLNGIQIYAPFIKIDSGFNGNCQLFATDSIIVDRDVVFSYPSVLGVVRKYEGQLQPTIGIGNNVEFNGVVFTHEEKKTPMQTMVKIGKDSRVTGEIYVAGILKMERGLVVNGKVSCNRFLMQTKTTLYENFLLDITFNRLARSSYYLSSRLFKNESENRILQWLE